MSMVKVNLDKKIIIGDDNYITIKEGLEKYNYNFNSNVDSWLIVPIDKSKGVNVVVEKLLEALIDLRLLLSQAVKMMSSMMIKITLSHKFWEDPIIGNNRISVIEEQEITKQLLTMKDLIAIKETRANEMETELIDSKVITLAE